MELDSIIMKAIKLVHSRSHDALDQLKQMTDEAISLRRGDLALRKMDEAEMPDVKPHKSRQQSDMDRKRESEKRSFEKLKEDLISLGEDGVQSKKPKLEDSRRDKDKERDRSKERKDDKRPTLKEDPSWLDFQMPKSTKISTTKPSVAKIESDSSGEESPSQRVDADQLADMMDLACVVCKQMDITSTNRLLDCQECHRLYHQECHKPAVNEDVDDPRFVWYCSKCSKTMKKLVKAQKPKPTSSSSSKEKETSKEPTKSFSMQTTTQTPFRRIESGKSSGTSKDSSSRPYTGFASLAANLSGKPGDKSRSSDPSKSSSKTDSSKGLGFLFKPDTKQIVQVSKEKSIVEKASQYRPGSGKSSSGKTQSSSSKSSSSSSKPSSSSSTKTSSSAPRSSSSSSSVSRSSSSSTPSSSSSSSSSSSKSMTSSSMMSADKKLQMMKKKAAARQVEKKGFR